MTAVYLNGVCLRRLQEEMPDIAELVAGAVNAAELAMLAVLIPDALTLWGSAARALQRGLREAVRNRYAVLAQEQQALALRTPEHP